MAFHIRKVLSHLSRDSLLTLAQKLDPEVANSVLWESTEAQVRDQLAQILLTEIAGRADLIASLERIHQMANEAGDRAMVAACGGDIDLRWQLTTQSNLHERALWLLGHDDDRFARAEDIRHADHYYGGRCWTGFIGPRNAWPELAGEPVQLFKGLVETAFRQYDGSGSNIVVESFERGPAHVGRYGEGRVYQLVIYLEGLPSTSTEVGEEGVVLRKVRPAVEVALVYASNTGVIDVVARAGRQLREAVAKAFVEELFPTSGQLEPVRLRQVQLAALALPCSFPVDPEDGIAGVRLTSLRLAPNGVEGWLTLEVANKNGRTLHEVARGWIGANDPLARRPAVQRARLAIRFHPGSGGSRARILRVELREPHGCNLRDRSDLERLVGEKYLRRWGLVRDL